MNKYILVDTWNGEGYSDSKATIIEAENYGKACEIAKAKAEEACGNNGTVRVFNKNSAQYTIDDDNGAFTVLPYEGQYGIRIFPDVNHFTTLNSRASYLQAMNQSAEQAEDEDDKEELLDNEAGCIHTGTGCEIFQKLTSEKDMEFVDYKGDDVEIWVNKLTGEKFEVETEIVRDFANMRAIKKQQ